MSSTARSAYRSWLSPLALAVSIAATPFTSTGAQGRPFQASSGSRVISPAVVAAWSAHADPSGAAILDFLVLLRGEPGWFMGAGDRTSGSSSSDGEKAGPVVMHLSYGDRDFSLHFDPDALTLTVQDEVVPLDSVNVVLVDGVDAADGVRLETALWVDPRLRDLEPVLVESLVRRAPAIFPFLRCDARLEDDAIQQAFAALCARMRPE